MSPFESKYGLDPYEVIGVRKDDSIERIKSYYYKKALVLHPDKTGGKTKEEFQILKEAYNSIRNDFEITELLSFNNKKKEKRISTKEIFPETFQSGNNERTFENYAPFLEDRLKDKFVAPKKLTTYDSSLPENTNYINISMKDFNKTFDYYKQKYEDEQNLQVAEVKKIKPVKEPTDLNYSKIYVYNGILVNQTDEEISEKERKKYQKKFGLKNPNIEEYQKEKNKIKTFKPKTVQEKEVKNTKYSPLDVKYETKFSDTNFEVNQLQEHKRYLEKSKSKIYNDPRISNFLLDQAHQGALECSTFKEEDLQSLGTLTSRLRLLESRKI